MVKALWLTGVWTGWVRGLGFWWPNGWNTKKVLAGGDPAGVGAAAAGVGAALTGAGAAAGAGAGAAGADCLGASGAALTWLMLGMLRGWKSSWTVPAGTTAAGLGAGGVAGVGLWLTVVLTVWVV